MFNVGNAVCVKDYAEIEGTFVSETDTSTKGVLFVPLMRRFCGKRFVISCEIRKCVYLLGGGGEENHYVWVDEWLRPAVKSPNEIF